MTAEPKAMLGHHVVQLATSVTFKEIQSSHHRCQKSKLSICPSLSLSLSQRGTQYIDGSSVFVTPFPNFSYSATLWLYQSDSFP